MTEIICITDKNHPALPAIIEWLYDWWGKDEDYTKEQVEAYVRNAVCKDRIPVSYTHLHTVGALMIQS